MKKTRLFTVAISVFWTATVWGIPPWISLVGPPVPIGNNLPAPFGASGAAWHEGKNGLLILDDHGKLSLTDRDGLILQNWTIPGSWDVEGVCVADPSSDFVYVAVEDPPGILEFDLSSGTIRRQIPLPIKTAFTEGLEAITFIPSLGQFVVGHKGTGTLHFVEIPMTDPTDTSAELKRSFETGNPPISGLEFWEDRLYVIYDLPDIMRSYRVADMGDVKTTDLPKEGQYQRWYEGIAFHDGDVFLVQDVGSGQVLRYGWEEMPVSRGGGSCFIGRN